MQRRIFDFVIRKDSTYTFVETNFFNDGGTKLKSVVGEFKGIQQLFNEHHPEYNLVWVTDGSGWKKSLYPLEDAFNHIPHIFNINDLNKGKLNTIL